MIPEVPKPQLLFLSDLVLCTYYQLLQKSHQVPVKKIIQTSCPYHQQATEIEISKDEGPFNSSP